MLAGWAAPAPAQPDELAVEQAQLAEKYQRLEALALRIAEVVATENPDRAEQLRSAIGKSRDRALQERFEAIVKLLEQESYAAARNNQGELADQLQTLLKLLMADPSESRRQAEQRLLREAIKKVKRLQREQRALRSETLNDATKEASESDQARLADDAQQLQQLLEEQAAGGSPDSPPPADAEAGDPKRRAASRLGEAQQKMREAAQGISQGEAAQAAESQTDADLALSRAQQELEEAMRQTREEEAMRTLTQLATRLRRMLSEQNEIIRLTVEVEQTHGAPATRRKRSAAAGLARREEQVRAVADAALRILEDDGKSVAFVEVLGDVRRDVQAVVDRLDDGQVAAVTQAIQADIVMALEDAIAALDQQLAEMQEQQANNQGGPGGPAQEPALVDRLAELRMIRAMQQRILVRTRRYEAMMTAEELSEQEFADALQDLALRQSRAAEAARSLAEGP